MEDSELLLTVAQVSVAFAGFSGLASVLGQHLSRSDPRLDAIRLRSVLFTALLATGFALLPFLPNRFGASPELSWRASATAFATAWVVFFIVETKRYREDIGKAGIPYLSALSAVNAGLYVLAILALLAVAIGFFPYAARGIYIFGLYVLLFVSATAFVRVFLSLLRGEPRS